MGLFSKKPKKPDYSDVIWMKREIKIKKMFEFIKNESEKRKVFVVSSFGDTLDIVEQAMKISGISYKRLNYLSDYSGDLRVCVMHSNLLAENTSGNLREAVSPAVVFTEHFPLPERDVAIMQNLVGLMNEPSLLYYLSLEDPIMQLFGSERIIGLMHTLGMGEDESIEHSFVSKALSNAQEKVAKKVASEIKSESEETWYRMNVKE
ncbi:MAG TPA: hypothetical protein DEA97_04130 [Bacteroidales bacterium]|nr:hypothetical protein [Bacteroidales bacterium]